MKTMIKTSVLALALMGGAAHAQSTPGQAVDINVSVGSQCSVDTPAAITLNNSSSAEEMYSNTEFFKVVCNKDLPYQLVFSGPGVDVSDGNFNVTLTNENGVGFGLLGLVHYTSTVNDFRDIGTGQEQKKALKFYYASDFPSSADVGNYSTTITTTVQY